jgi:hypothetical protein
MAPAQNKKRAILSEKSSGFASNLNMNVGSLNPHIVQQSPPQYFHQKVSMTSNTRNNNAASHHHHHHQQQQQQPHLRQQASPINHNLVEAASAPPQNSSGSFDPGINSPVSLHVFITTVRISCEPAPWKNAHSTVPMVPFLLGSRNLQQHNGPQDYSGPAPIFWLAPIKPPGPGIEASQQQM